VLDVMVISVTKGGVDEVADGTRHVNGRPSTTSWLAATACSDGEDHGWVGTRHSSSNNKCSSPPFN